jgi:hypothetical protein
VTAYVKKLRREFAASQRRDDPGDLRQRFLDWYTALPSVVRDRPFSMQEFEAALATQGKYISAVLLGLGWQRKRQWSTTGRYHRYWIPPTPK